MGVVGVGIQTSCTHSSAPSMVHANLCNKSLSPHAGIQHPSVFIFIPRMISLPILCQSFHIPQRRYGWEDNPLVFGLGCRNTRLPRRLLPVLELMVTVISRYQQLNHFALLEHHCPCPEPGAAAANVVRMTLPVCSLLCPCYSTVSLQ